MRFRCLHCTRDPGEPGAREGFLFESDKPVCPRCGKFGPMILPIVDVHFLAEDPAGPILGQSARYRVACEPKRDGLAMHAHDTYAATGDVRAVTCRSCKATQAFVEQSAFLPELAHLDEIQKRMARDCCG
jgi:hypothetical protein